MLALHMLVEASLYWGKAKHLILPKVFWVDPGAYPAVLLFLSVAGCGRENITKGLGPR